MGKFKHPRKGVKMNRTTTDVATPVPWNIIEHYKAVHLDTDLLLVYKLYFIKGGCRSADEASNTARHSNY